ncbi:MAG: hypothetical protein LUH82_03025, partial [Clostridiales bacterium]|nr:hypothetical protein [Clostridiales bacterium]
MKTCKKLLSLFLALIMALTACTSGFAVFAAEDESTSAFSAENASAAGSVDALNSLLDTYLPTILELIGADTLSKIGVDIDKVSSASFSDESIKSDAWYEFFTELASYLYPLLAGTTDKDEILASNGTLNEDLFYASSYDEFKALAQKIIAYDYLEDEDADFDFWTLYDMCLNADSSSNKEFAALLEDYFNGYTNESGNEVLGLQDLLYAATNELSAAAKEQEELETILKTMFQIFCEDAYTQGTILSVAEISTAVYDFIAAYPEYGSTVEELVNLLLDEEFGTDYTFADVKGQYSYYTSKMSAVYSGFEVSSFAELLYVIQYMSIDMDSMAEMGDFLDIMLLGTLAADNGADFSYWGISSLTFDNYLDEMAAYYSSYGTFDDYTLTQLCAAFLGGETLAVYYAYPDMYAESGVLEKELDEIAAELYFTDEQLAYLTKYIEKGAISSAEDLCAAIVNDTYGLGFSDTLKYIFGSGDYSLAAIASADYAPMRQTAGFYGVTAQDVYDALAAGTSLGAAETATGSTIKEEIDWVLEFVYCVTNYGESPFSLAEVDALYESVSGTLNTTYKYDYSNYTIDNEYIIDLLNVAVNSYIDYIPALNDTLSGLSSSLSIDNIIAGLTTTKDSNGDSLSMSDLTGALYDVVYDLAYDPVSTIANLLPLLIILIDEVVLPLFLGEAPVGLVSIVQTMVGDADVEYTEIYNNSGLYNLLYYVLGDLLGTTAVKDLFDEYGVHTLYFNLNYILPALLHYMFGDTSVIDEWAENYGNESWYIQYYPYGGYYENVTTSSGGKVPVIFNIEYIDTWVAENLYNLTILNTLSDGAGEAVRELLSVVRDAVDYYLDGNASLGIESHRFDSELNANDVLGGGNDDSIKMAYKVGINNLLSALPEIINIMGQIFLDKYSVDSDWAFNARIDYSETITTGSSASYSYTTGNESGGNYTTVPYHQNETLTVATNLTLAEIKAHVFDSAGEKDAANVTAVIVNLLVSDWVNALIDLFNDVFTTDNIISTQIPIVCALVESVDLFGEKSLLSDVINGFFSLTRSSDYSFALAEQPIPQSADSSATYVGFSENSAYYLVANLNVIIDLIINIIDSSGSSSGGSGSSGDSGDSGDSGSSSSSTSGVVSALASLDPDYESVITAANTAAADELLATLDEVLHSLFVNTLVDGFDLDSTDSVLSAVVTFLTNHLGAGTAEDITDLLKDYLVVITASNVADADGDVDESAVYSAENLSNLVTQTYLLLEEIIGSLFDGLIAGDTNGYITNAVKGIISPGAVTNYSTEITDDIMSCLTWQEVSAGKYALALGYDSIGAAADADVKAVFYECLADSLGPVAAVLGALLVSTDYYNDVLLGVFGPVFENCNSAYVTLGADASGVETVTAILTDLSNYAAVLIETPATTLMNTVSGLSESLTDDGLKSLLSAVFTPLADEISGLAGIVRYLSPTYAESIDELAATIGSYGDTLLADYDDNYIVSIINSLLGGVAALPEINFAGLNGATAGETLLAIYTFGIDFVLDSSVLTALIGDEYTDIIEMVSALDPAAVLELLNQVLSVTQDPTEVYWLFSEYASESTGSFIYPAGITAADAESAVTNIDSLVKNVFVLLEAFGVTDVSSLKALVSQLLYTNDLVTTVATAIYGALEDTVIGVTPAQFAEYLTDSSYGAEFTAAAQTLAAASDWGSVDSLDWGFADGSQAGFIAAVSALCRPVNDLLAMLLAGGGYNVSDTLLKIVQNIELDSTTASGDVDITIVLKDGVLTLTTFNNAATDAKTNTIEIDLAAIIKDSLSNISIYGSNGYESAIIPILEAFMCSDVKTYSEYVSDYNAAKDNLLIDILTPLLGFVDDVLDSPADTITAVLPNVAYFISQNGVANVLSNLLSPVTETIIDALSDHDIDIDLIIEQLAGKGLGSLITDALGIDAQLTLNLSDLSTCNIQDIVLPLLNSLLADYKIELSDFTWESLASHGVGSTVESAAKNSAGNYETVQVKAYQGETLIAVLRYVAEQLINNCDSIRNLIYKIDAVASNETITNVVRELFYQLSLSSKDGVVIAVIELINQEATQIYWSFDNYLTQTSADFTYPDGLTAEDALGAVSTA